MFFGGVFERFFDAFWMFFLAFSEFFFDGKVIDFLMDFWSEFGRMSGAPTLDPLENSRVIRGVRLSGQVPQSDQKVIGKLS